MVGEEPAEYGVVLTPQFLEDLESCVDYVEVVLGSPLAARRMYDEIRERVMALGAFPKASLSYVSPTTGNRRYKISYGRYDIHYSVDDDGMVVRVLGIKHQLQNSSWIG